MNPTVKERYGKIALVGGCQERCCAPTECCGSSDSNNDSHMMGVTIANCGKY